MTDSSQQSSSPKAAAGTKHKADSQSLPKSKRGTAEDGKKEQITLEESIDNGNGEHKTEDPSNDKGTNGKEELKSNNHKDDLKGSEPSKEETSAKEESAVPESTEVEERGEEMPSSMIEKGLIYFFIRPRVNITDPHAVDDIARTYIVLRPLPLSAKLTDDTILATNSAENRVIALPKKVFPAGGQDKFMFFVEKANSSIHDIKTFLATTSDDNASPAIPAGEGIYALTSANNATHLSYILTLPSEPSKVQSALNLATRGHYTLSAKNPTVKGPASASLPQGPDYPKDILDLFGARRWLPPTKEMFGYENAQFLIIGSEGSRNAEIKDQEEGGDEGVVEELEKLEDEDEKRVEGLGEREKDRLFEELGIGATEVRNTW